MRITYTEHIGRTVAADGWEHDAWVVTLRNDETGREMSLDYKMGVGHNGLPPDEYDVLSSLFSDASLCVECGHDIDEWRNYFTLETKFSVVQRAMKDTWRNVNAFAHICGVKVDDLDQYRIDHYGEDGMQ